MSFVLFFFKVFVFNLLVSKLLGLALTPLVKRALSEQPSVGAGTGSPQKLATPDVIAFVLLLALCFLQGLLVAGALGLSLQSHPDAWRPLWYLVGAGSFLPVSLAAYPKDDTRARTGQVLGYLGSLSGYLLASFWPGVVPGALLVMSRVLAV
ncbi:hypothetical protein D187_010216 [Cystobacter fuscus DSM 2262]|uniref:Uncharacterized protein n=1 Tax=Cystobacter fuscus (strain ATCC 25194 / DSM 2262 / NBRC 100088 / M29) TaxID=1242864 RepID=S9PGT6_CYSF2|nr:hypothetical protein [Cystobacter fuscus]EPX61597.1 hypothetical protein D187_010216 [Cystobacter fuscus DSM 2262]